MIGYRFIHTLNRIGTWVMGSALLAGFVMMFSQALPTDFFSRGAFNLSGFVATVSLGVIWQISFSPYTSDYSRYLPREVGIAKPFWATYFGATLGTILCFTFGAVAVLCVPEGTDAMAAVEQATGWLGPVLMVLFLCNIISTTRSTCMVRCCRSSPPSRPSRPSGRQASKCGWCWPR